MSASSPWPARERDDDDFVATAPPRKKMRDGNRKITIARHLSAFRTLPDHGLAGTRRGRPHKRHRDGPRLRSSARIASSASSASNASAASGDPARSASSSPSSRSPSPPSSAPPQSSVPPNSSAHRSSVPPSSAPPSLVHRAPVDVMANLVGVLAESIIELTKNPHQGRSDDARASIRAALAANSQLAIRTIQAIVVSSGIHSPESFAELLFEFIDPVVVNGLIATPYEPTDTDSIAALASLLSCVSPDKRAYPKHYKRASFYLYPWAPFFFFCLVFWLVPRLCFPYRPAHRKGSMHCERWLARRRSRTTDHRPLPRTARRSRAVRDLHRPHEPSAVRDHRFPLPAPPHRRTALCKRHRGTGSAPRPTGSHTSERPRHDERHRRADPRRYAPRDR